MEVVDRTGEKKAMIKGVPLEGLKKVLLLGVGLLLLPEITRVANIKVSGYYYLVVIGVLIVSINLMKRLASKGHRNFLGAYYAYHFTLPRRLSVKRKNPNLKNAKPLGRMMITEEQQKIFMRRAIELSQQKMNGIYMK